MRHSDSVFRGCSRCGRELTDAASRECGVGPVCRRKNNDIFARQIPANLTLASITMLNFEASDFHARIADEWSNVLDKFLVRTEQARREFGGNVDSIPGADFRFVADWFDKALSYPMTRGLRMRIITVVEQLGYISLGSILRGDACMSPAELRLEDDRVVLVGKSNKSGWRAMKSAFGRNVKTPRYRGDATPYSVHVSHAEKFVEIALRYWPFMKEIEKADDLVEQAKDAAQTAAPEDNRPVARVVGVGPRRFNLSLPWSGTREQMMVVIDQIKALPKRERGWDARGKLWQIDNKHREDVMSMVRNSGLFRAAEG